MRNRILFDKIWVVYLESPSGKLHVYSMYVGRVTYSKRGEQWNGTLQLN